MADPTPNATPDSTRAAAPDRAGWLRRGGCALQQEVLAMRRDPTAVPPARRQALEAHLAGCADCRRALTVDGALATLAAEGPGFRLPEPGHVYWRAQVLERLAERTEAAELAARPLRWVQLLGGLLAALLAVVGAIQVWDDLPSLVAAGSLGGDATTLLHLAVWLGLALLAGAGLLAAHTLVEER